MVVSRLTLHCQAVDIIQGEQKVITLISEDSSGFPSAEPTSIEVKLQDSARHVLTKSNGDIERLLEDEHIQVVRFTLTPTDTALLEPGFIKLQIAYDLVRSLLELPIKVHASLD